MPPPDLKAFPGCGPEWSRGLTGRLIQEPTAESRVGGAGLPTPPSAPGRARGAWASARSLAAAASPRASR